VTIPNPTTAPEIAQVTLDQLLGQTKVVTATFTGTPSQEPQLDVDANRQASALFDGILLARYLSGITGPDLTAGALGANAQRTTPSAITSYLGFGTLTMLDVDGNGQTSALFDGILLARYLSGITGPDLIAGALGANAQRTTPAAISTFLQQYQPGQPATPQEATAEQAALPMPATAAASSSGEPVALSAPVPSLVAAPPASGAIAAIQLARQPVQTSSWVSQFVGNQAVEEEQELVVTL
jgi:hypothetical protein